MWGSREPSNQIVAQLFHAFLYLKFSDWNIGESKLLIMRKIILLAVVTTISMNVMSQTRTRVEVEYTIKRQTPISYTPIYRKDLVLPSGPEYKFVDPFSSSYLEEQVRQARLNEELEEIEARRELRRLRKTGNSKENETLQNNRQNSSSNETRSRQSKTYQEPSSNRRPVFSYSPLYDSASQTQSKEITHSQDGYVTLISRYNDKFYKAEMNGLVGYFWVGWLK